MNKNDEAKTTTETGNTCGSGVMTGSALPILIGCEESQVITGALRAAGHEAYSCDLQRGATRIGITSRILWM